MVIITEYLRMSSVFGNFGETIGNSNGSQSAAATSNSATKGMVQMGAIALDVDEISTGVPT
jgi:hypothetical protein